MMSNTKRVMLVHVRDPQFYAIQQGTRSPNGNRQVMGFPPIGVMLLSAVLKEAGHACTVFDQADPETPNDVIVKAICAAQPDLVGLSFLSTTSYPYAKVLARQIRSAWPQVKLAFGGVFATLNAERVKRQCSDVDFVCRGDGEQLLLDLLEALDNPGNVAGLTWEKNGEVISNPERIMERNLDQWPIPDRECLKLDFVESMPLDVPVILSTDRFTTMQTSRGCPWPCVFCDIPNFSSNKWRPRTPENVVAELKHLEANGYRSVYFVDDNFLLQPKRIERICELIIEQGLSIRWGCEGRVDSVVQPLFPLMARANCRTIMFGIESGSQKVLDRLKKKQTIEDISEAVIAAKRAGIELVHGFFVVGSPDETQDDMMKGFRLAAKLPLDTFGFNRLCVYRGSPLWDEYVQRGLVDDTSDWYKYFKCSEIDPTCMSGDEIHALRKKGFKYLFLYKLTHYPRQTFWLIRRFMQYMSLRDINYIIFKPFLGKSSGATRAEVLSRAVEHGEMKDAAADLTQVSDSELLALAKTSVRVDRDHKPAISSRA
ncbi:MAG: radical SAM protein [Gammaproteobacteria bacterium]